MKKILKKILNCILICIISCFVLMQSSVFASVTMSSYADKTYSSVMQDSVSTLFSNSWYYDGDSARFARCNYMCLEKSSASASVNFKVCLVIDINTDGSNVDYATYYYKNSSGSVVSATVENSKIAELAYVAYYSDHASSTYNWTCTAAFAYVWSSQHENARALFSCASSLPNDYGSGYKTSINTSAQSYASSGSYNGKTIKARIIIFDGGASQNTAFVYGELTDAAPSLNKYVSEVGGSDVEDRSSLSESSKQSDPENAAPGETVKFNIHISNPSSSTISVTLTDTFDSIFEFQGSSSYWSGSGTTYTRTVSVQSGGTTVSITLKIKDDASTGSTKYKNTVSMTYGSKTYTSSDYIKVKTGVTIDKAVYKIAGKEISDDRLSWSESDKRSSPELVKLGEKVVYKIKITNKNSYDLTDITITDVYEACFNCSDSNWTASTTEEYTMTRNVGTIKAGKSKTVQITLKFVSQTATSLEHKYTNTASITLGETTISSTDWIYTDGSGAIEINKYITKVNGTNVSTSRADYSEEEKEDSPVSVSPGDQVRFRINVENCGNSSITVTLRDIYDTDCFSFADTENNENWTSATNGYSRSLTLSAGASTSVYIDLDVISTVYGGGSVYENKARINKSDVTYTSSDFVKVDTELTINKYISSISYSENSSLTVDDRSSMSESEKSSSPYSLTVKNKNKGYTLSVTYTIDISCSTAYTFRLIDKFDGVFSFSSGDFSKYSSNQIYYKKVSFSEGGTKQLTITLNVNKSRLKNGGTYQNKVYVYGDSSITSSDYITISWSNSDAGGSYSKYIYKVMRGSSTVYDDTAEGNTSRSSLNNTSKSTNPIVLQSGDVVYYKIVINLTDHWCEYSFADVMGSGLSYNDDASVSGDSNLTITKTSSGFTAVHSHSGSDCEDCEDCSTCLEDATVTISFSANVTVSDLTLGILTNTVSFNSGSTWVEHTATYYCDGCEEDDDGDTYCPGHEYTYMLCDDTTAAVSTSSSNSDYVALVTPEIAGTVWIDTDDDGVIDSGESGYESANVYLYDKSTDTVVASTTTDSSGNFSFGRVAKGTTNGTSNYTTISSSENCYNCYYSGSYKEYYIKYEYFGIKYESTSHYTDGTNANTYDASNEWMSKSHAQESNVSEDNRQNFNNGFETIAYDVAYSDTSGSSETGDLEYSKNGHISEIQWNDTTTIASQSFDLYVNPSSSSKTAYLQHMNLGLVERAQTDLELTKDVVSAYVTINGKETTYNYNALGTDGYDCEYYLSTPYELKIYNEDYSYRSSSYSDSTISSLKSGTELEITLTYKITITNVSTGYYNVIREIIDISSDEMSLSEVYGYNSSGEKITYTSSSDSVFYDSSAYNYEGCNTTFITGCNEVLGSGDKLEIYLDYTVNKDEEGNIMVDSSTDDLGKMNIAQIGAFSTYNDEALTTPSGVVDGDSNPGNIVIYDSITDFDNYEDDIFYTTILLLLREGDDALRSISGNVWEDLETEENSLGQNYGDGLKDGENGAKNVTVRLMEVVSGTATNENGGTYSFEYLVDTGISAKTDLNGDYTLKDEDNLHAGTYIVRFIYGDNASDLVGTGDTIKYSGQDYKSTTYTNVGDTDDETEIVEATAFTEAKDDAGKEISVARDNELRRLEVISYSTTMNYTLDAILKADDAEEMKTLAENTGMYADTLSFNIQIEYYDNYSDKTKFEINGLNTYKYEVKDVDFGLIERPQTILKLMNDMTELIATASNGSELIHLYFDITYYLDDNGEVQHTSTLNETTSVGYSNVQILNRTSTNQGYRYVNIDSQYLQGMTITAKYQLAVINISDIDTSSQNLVDMVKNYDVENVVNYLKSCTSIDEDTVYSYNVDSDNSIKVSDYMLLNYSYTELDDAIDELNDSNDYSSYANGESYEYGYFLGETYYAVRITETETSDSDEETSNTLGANDVIVETRVDQVVDYIIPDLVFVMLDNTNESGSPKFVAYTIEAIAEKGLLAEVTENTVRITDGSESYIDVTDNTENNLVFSTESETINSELYRYLEPVSGTTEKQITVSSLDENGDNVPTTTTVNAYDEEDLYVIDIQGSKVLSSENDELYAYNIAEIVKVSNTVGRKVYISSNLETGYIGSSTATTTTTTEDTDSGSSDDSDSSEEIVVNFDTVKTAGESDTDYTEYITISAPTGLSIKEQRETNVTKVVATITASLACVCAILIIIKIIKNRKKFYR